MTKPKNSYSCYRTLSQKLDCIYHVDKLFSFHPLKDNFLIFYLCLNCFCSKEYFYFDFYQTNTAVQIHSYTVEMYLSKALYFRRES